MDINGIAEFTKLYLAAHGPFFAMAIFLAMVGVFMKGFVWTKERASVSVVAYWARACLPLHPVFAGAALGLLGRFVFGEDMLASPGVPITYAALAMYYGGAGMASGWVWAGLKHFLKARGIALEAISMPSVYPRGR